MRTRLMTAAVALMVLAAPLPVLAEEAGPVTTPTTEASTEPSRAELAASATTAQLFEARNSIRLAQRELGIAQRAGDEMRLERARSAMDQALVRLSAVLTDAQRQVEVARASLQQEAPDAQENVAAAVRPFDSSPTRDAEPTRFEGTAPVDGEPVTQAMATPEQQRAEAGPPVEPPDADPSAAPAPPVPAMDPTASAPQDTASLDADRQGVDQQGPAASGLATEPVPPADSTVALAGRGEPMPDVAPPSPAASATTGDALAATDVAPPAAEPQSSMLAPTEPATADPATPPVTEQSSALPAEPAPAETAMVTPGEAQPPLALGTQPGPEAAPEPLANIPPAATLPAEGTAAPVAPATPVPAPEQHSALTPAEQQAALPAPAAADTAPVTAEAEPVTLRTVMGREVYGSRGEPLGRVEDLLVSGSTGGISALLVRVDQSSDDSVALVRVPFTLVQMGNGRITVPMNLTTQ
ncbi:hypothetical protein HHL28_04520 [Aerophototrophica crusticola]|uniref:PRC-barrel domain-containing protein n=1 Tax=Aerophototrophica crusticola TaxID=1709002 RepID=A0A858R4R8_9PROT|nr:hypothetical protein HHL28_04520 [Rhodospirillaceae bacterium B3]